MKVNRKVIESAAVVVFAFAIMVTAVTAENASTKAEQYTGQDMTEEAEVPEATKEKTDVGVVAAAEEQEAKPEADAQDTNAEATDAQAEQQTPDTGDNKNTEKDADAEAADAKADETTESEVVSEWATRLMPNVEEFLNIRAQAGEEAEVVGKLYKGAAADIQERGEVWSKISSGSVEGYVKNEFCVFDAEAEAMANEQGTVYATALTGGLRVRAQANAAEEVTIVDVLEEGEKIKVDTAAEVPEGWVAVVVSDQTAYVNGEFVTVELELGKAISIEEEQAAIKKAEEEAAAKKAAKSASSGTTQRGAVAASYDDVTLLGALIQCEAGGESYEGQLAVGAVVMNRLRNGYSGSISGVIYQSGQFTPASSGTLASRLASGVSGSCLQAAQEAINGADNVSGATSFRRASSGQGGIVIGNHVFY